MDQDSGPRYAVRGIERLLTTRFAGQVSAREPNKIGGLGGTIQLAFQFQATLVAVRSSSAFDFNLPRSFLDATHQRICKPTLPVDHQLQVLTISTLQRAL